MNNTEKMDLMMKKKVWAIVGATFKRDKISNKIYHSFKSAGYDVYAVNPNCETMDDGNKCYESIQDLPKVPDCIDFVVAPEITLKYLKSMDPATIPYIWLQPGTYDENVVKFAEDKGFTVVHENACTLVYLSSRS